MDNRIPSIPSISSTVPTEVAAVLRPLRLAMIELITGEDRAITLREAAKSGLVDGVGDDGKIVVPKPPEVDNTPPPTPTGLKASGAFSSIQLSWDKPSYKNYSHTEVWAAQVDSFAVAQLIGRSDGFIYTDYVGGAIKKYYWIRFISKTDVAGAFNAQAGTPGETGNDPAFLLSLLNGRITEDQLFRDLGAKIAKIAENTSAISSEAETRSTAVSGLATKVDTFETRIGNNAAAIQSEATVRASQTGELYGRIGVKVDLNGYISGWGLLSTNNNGTPTSDFAIRADKFYIASPSGGGISPVVPFIVRTSGSFIGPIYIPPGVYMNNAFIENGSISNAKIGNAAVDNAKIVDGTITNAKIYDLDATKITTGFLDAARIQVGTLDAKIANINAATIGSGVIDKARIPLLTASKIDGKDLVVMSGGYVNYGWPPAGSRGFYLGPEGLLIGNPASGGGFFQYDQYSGNFYCRAFTIINGVATIDAADIRAGTIDSARIGTASIDTLKIAGNSATVMQAARAYNSGLVRTTITVTAADIPAGRSTVPIVVTGAQDVLSQTYFDIGVNQGNYSFSGNLLWATPPIGGTWSYTVIYDAAPGTYEFVCYNHGAGDNYDPNTRQRSITAILGKR